MNSEATRIASAGATSTYAHLLRNANARDWRVRVVVVDDVRDAADSLALLFRLRGCDTRVAYDGDGAVRVAEEFRPDAMVLDIGLPNGDGYEVARRIRREPWGADVVLVALTGWGRDTDRVRALDAGFNHHFLKPADPSAIAETWQHGLRRFLRM